MRAKDVMTTRVVTVTPDTPVPEIARLLLERRISAAPVVDAAERMVGIVSEGDLIRRPETGTERHRPWWLKFLAGAEELAEEYVKTHGVKASDVMTRRVVSVNEDAELGEIAQLLEERRIKRVPVVRDGKLVGIVSRADLLRGLAARKAPGEPGPSVDDRAVRERILRVLDKEGWAEPAYVNIVVTNGTAHLWGLVDSDEQRRALRIAVEGVPGVRAVADHLGEVAPYLRGA